MNDFEKRQCLHLTNKMIHKDLCHVFKDKVDPERDGAPDYYKIIKHPIDLTTIKRKLNSNEYKSIEQWADDVNLVWKNAKTYNNEGSVIHFIAQEQEIWFARKYKNIPRTKDEEWVYQLQKATKILSRLATQPPNSIVPSANVLFDLTKIQAELAPLQTVTFAPVENKPPEPEPVEEQPKSETPEVKEPEPAEETQPNQQQQENAELPVQEASDYIDDL
ncbi:Bromodomain containing protein [Trichomonas vaginalis G3]|uniref:Bromodomain containing protein n=1 Tax=Trichomonas vaginalis (strain ATCC PRA-98 / G3) TaxID=412133 RepID=A2FQR9_TRIV3|nr:acetylation-dependent protein binding [Trichomonas vaginalis G3]EAX92740.1 Bromodomain containing protein [Trichomonas vaginalis G3]KAI5515571.1 acetylation-dependent protein binding [Trichomonas vaginalis G3]|eukprot:XP_001305670.1 Bromodomain containing protein [Trichomonas vaginalis G3]